MPASSSIVRWLCRRPHGVRSAAIGLLLAGLAQVAARRTRTPPFGLCHSEFAAASLHIGPPHPAEDRPDPIHGLRTLRLLDFARAYTGPGLLDLAAWPGHRRQLAWRS